MDRRSFLVASGTALAPVLVGCVGAPTEGATESPRTPSTPGNPSDGPTEVHDLYVENHTDSTETGSIEVVREDGATIVDGRYELPDGRGIEFEDVAAWETTYTVDLAIDGGPVASFEWVTAECGRDSEAPGDGGSRNAAVRVEKTAGGGGQVSFVRDQCDAIVAGTVPTGPAGSFRLDG